MSLEGTVPSRTSTIAGKLPDIRIRNSFKICFMFFIVTLLLLLLLLLRGGVMSFIRPGRKQATATNLGVYSTYSPRSSIYFLVSCSNFCKPLKKIQKFVRPTRSPRQQWPPRQKKNDDLWIVFLVQGTGGSPTGPDPENRVGDQDIRSPGRPVSSGLQGPGGPGRCRGRTRPHWWPSRGVFFLQTVLQLHQQRWVIRRVDSLVLWKIFNGRMPSWSQKIEARNFPADFCTRTFLGRGEQLCRHFIDCCFVSRS